MAEKTIHLRFHFHVYQTCFQVFQDNFAHGDLHPGNILVIEKKASDLKQKKLWSILPFNLTSKSTTYPVSIVILDCGIIASLDDRGKECLIGVFKAVASGDVSSGLFCMFMHSMIMYIRILLGVQVCLHVWVIVMKQSL
jgi:predicted unusual protein kinase regulating ubiquinone biosynthesis (AarF/ABC1/UbiB family)